ncbi:hypothetical protein COX24_02115 [bacterium (Candidatus Gribaldobacteria) CG23_combo_of_CG06-09_8_20_14_all_37_87_8]|uniref:Type II toxin-antitoxin system mRNA interferase toxin, RelE/StbE family n=2 Tax=Candidatus Gribaldobacteria TaxID=2798536 RepID=A0A2G9ZF11_9BACT|nr:MAG: hypothetical protein AUJ25_02610 [Parcubacteria group bacterium CG1_02_37_13]PIP31701.1 MAG: hypothetical protein COX24_02115 [bacterium (Candidatus Gribaldobacteria) CG23_combo_of_CG06-09_8_20_14_all_37_87_8]PIR90010.1 MAG: type II toxin-antitoxin system mRNA interferase toxin, RelE/StbE family [bacterium (Candidatus Gribaldobacteria) CG10_big_fil_rev_8_21_14_0_10_37_21]
MAEKVSKIHYTSHYLKGYAKLPKRIQGKQDKKEQWFRANPFDIRLETHNLQGNLKGFYAYSITRTHRALFRFITPNEVIFYDIGTHSVYK